MLRRQPEKPPNPPQGKGFEILDAEPWTEHGAVDRLIALQKQVFVAELADEPATVGTLYGQMAETEASISNYGEEAGYAYDAAQTFTEAGLLEDAIAAHYVRAVACFKMNKPDTGYSAFQDAITVRKQIATLTKEKLASEKATVIIARHRPVTLEPPEDPDDSMSKLWHGMHNKQATTFENWLRSAGESAVAGVLRTVEESHEAGFAMNPLVDGLAQLIHNFAIPRMIHEELLTDLSDLQGYGPYPFGLNAMQGMQFLGSAYVALANQQSIRRKPRKRAQVEGFFLLYAAEEIGRGTHFGGFASLPHPVGNIRSLKEIYLKRYEYNKEMW